MWKVIKYVKVDFWYEHNNNNDSNNNNNNNSNNLNWDQLNNQVTSLGNSGPRLSVLTKAFKTTAG